MGRGGSLPAAHKKPSSLLTLRKMLTGMLPNALVIPEDWIESEWAPPCPRGIIQTLSDFHFY